jgi:pimeloyl-ACP methyl ester carboxylesterase
MVTEQHINGTYFKYYQEKQNKHLLFLLPGQSLSPRAFWDFELPDGKTHAQHFVESGIDVVLFDPVGYGNSKHFYNYNRIKYAEQIKTATEQLKKKYKTKTIFGFSTSTAPAMIAGHNGFFNKIIIHSPGIQERHEFLPFYRRTGYSFDSNFEILIRERIQKISDVLIPKSNKIDNWVQRVRSVVGNNWRAPYQTVNDNHTYWLYNKTHSLTFNTSVNTLILVGEYDNEIVEMAKCYSRFKTMFPDNKSVVIPNSTHFSMWENNSHLTRQAIIDYIKE